MEPERITGKDVELLGIGLLCLMLSGSTVLYSWWSPKLVAAAMFGFLGVVSFGLVWWDVRMRAALATTSE